MSAIRVLVPVDGSEPTLRALARGLPRFAPPVELTLLVVMDAKLRAMPEEAREHLEWDDEDELILRPDEAEAVLDRAEAVVKGFKGVKIHRVIVEGDVLDAVTDHAGKHDVLLMHALHRVEKDDERRLSLTEGLARAAHCDVLLVYDESFR